MDKLNQIHKAVDQLYGKENLNAVDSIFSVDYLAHSGDKTYHGQKFINQYFKQLHKAFPDVKVLNIELLSQADNKITWQRILHGTHKANMKGIPASNKKVKWYEIVVTRFDNNKIIEEWVVSDLAFQLMLKHKR